MKITLCGSIAFIHEMDVVRGALQALGHEVKMPPLTKPGEHGEPIPALEYYTIKKSAVQDPTHWFWKKHDEAIRAHFQKVAWADAVLITNYDKNGVANYIGPNTLMEMGLAFHLEKPIYLLNAVPEISYAEELLGMKPIVLHGDLKTI